MPIFGGRRSLALGAGRLTTVVSRAAACGKPGGQPLREASHPRPVDASEFGRIATSIHRIIEAGWLPPARVGPAASSCWCCRLTCRRSRGTSTRRSDVGLAHACAVDAARAGRAVHDLPGDDEADDQQNGSGVPVHRHLRPGARAGGLDLGPVAREVTDRRCSSAPRLRSVSRSSPRRTRCAHERGTRAVDP